MKRQSFVLSAIILALGGFFAKAIGALYKIPLTNILGSGGMGLYYLIFPIYSLIITICSSGLSVSLATNVARCRKVRNRYNEQKLLRVALVLGFAISVVFATIIITISKPLAYAQGNINAYKGYIAIAPAIIISTLIAVLRGYFQGVENMVPTTISLIIEQIVKLSVGLILAHQLCQYGIQYAVLGAVVGVTISEVVALIIISINFFTYKGQLYYNYRNLNYKSRQKLKVLPILKCNNKYSLARNNNSKLYKCSSLAVRYTTKKALKILLSISLPSMLSSIIIPISTMLDSLMIINILSNSGYSSLVSTSLYGLWGGIVQTLLSLPTIIVSAIATSLVPSLSGLVAQNDTNEIKKKVAFFIKLTWVLSLLMFVIVFVFAEDILMFLYGDGLSNSVIDELYYATKMLKISSVSIVYYAFLQTFTSIMQSIGKSFIPVIALGCGIIIRTILITVLVGNANINIFGAIIANIVFLIIATILMAFALKYYIDIKYNFYNHLIKPIIVSAILLVGMIIVKWGLKGIINYFFAMIISAIIGVVIFVIWVYFSKIFTPKEKSAFNLRKKTISRNK